jgi:acetate kinase
MTAPVPCVVVFNGGSSSIRFAVYEAGDTLRRRLDGKIDRIGVSEATFIVNDPGRTSQTSRPLAAAEVVVREDGHIPCSVRS